MRQRAAPSLLRAGGSPLQEAVTPRHQRPSLPKTTELPGRLRARNVPSVCRGAWTFSTVSRVPFGACGKRPVLRRFRGSLCLPRLLIWCSRCVRWTVATKLRPLGVSPDGSWPAELRGASLWRYGLRALRARGRTRNPCAALTTWSGNREHSGPGRVASLACPVGSRCARRARIEHTTALGGCDGLQRRKRVSPQPALSFRFCGPSQPPK